MHLTLSCLAKMSRPLGIEVIVVDNNSSEHVVHFNQTAFPDFKFISNDINLGFSKANNLGIEHAQSENILILNPDTIISEEIVQQAIQLLNSDKKIGAVAVRMMDGRGDYLPESARGFPDLKSSFLKLLGLKKWSSYYKTQDTNDHIEVMSGACMFFKKDIYKAIGGLDERFFMYGEDIDISYQLHKAGFVIKYISDKEIVHFKGRSSVKSNWRYQTAFYNAMKLYWQKNFQWGQQPILNFVLNLALGLLKILSALRHGFKMVLLPIADFIGIILASAVFTYLWSVYIKLDVGFLPLSFYMIILPLYTLTAILSMLFAKFYLTEIDISKLVKASIVNLILFLIVYFLLPVDYKYSRAVIVYLAVISFFVPLLIRWIYTRWFKVPLLFTDTKHLEAKILPDNSKEEAIKELINRYSNYQLVMSAKQPEACILDLAQTTNLELLHSIKHTKQNGTIWIYSDHGQYLMRCHGKDALGFIIAADENFAIYEWTHQVRKRILDIFFCILAPPISLLSKHSFFQIIKSCHRVLFRGSSWVHVNDKAIYQLSTEVSENYLRNYSLKDDIYYFFRYMFIS